MLHSYLLNVLHYKIYIVIRVSNRNSVARNCAKLRANTKTAGGYTASYIRQASLELGGVPIPLFDVGLGGILKGSHPDLSYIRNRTCDSA